MGGSTTVLLGTTKGVFLLDPDGHGEWSVRGPFCDGWTVNHVIGDPGAGTLWAAGGTPFTGAGVWNSVDGGTTWDLSRFSHGEWENFIRGNPEQAAAWGLSPSPDAPFTGEVDALWSLAAADGVLYAGAKPAQLFASRDGGVTWDRVGGLNEHPTAAAWQPGAAGLTLHTIIVDPHDPTRLWVGISAAGVFASEDGGKTWDLRIRRSNAEAVENPEGMEENATRIGGCVHNMGLAPGGPGDALLYQQNHQGVFRSRDGGRSWDDINAGLPSDFGFPVGVHPTDPQTLWVFPLNGDTKGRFPPDAAAAVWRSRDGGESWSACRNGLPQTFCYFTVLRQAMAVDRGTPAGVWFGTNSGSVFHSADEGDSWSEIARHLPTILSVEVLTPDR